MNPRLTDQEAAIRALESPEFAQKVLTGEADHPAVRNAILADLYKSAVDESEDREHPDRTGFAVFQKRTVDVRPNASPMGPCYVRYYPKMPAPDVWQDWGELSKTNLAALARQQV
jgi:hypothetical protein